MAVHNLYLYDKTTGICLMHEKVGSLSLDENIMTSHLTNLGNMAQIVTAFFSGANKFGEELSKSDQIGIKNMCMGDYEIYFEKGNYIQSAAVVDPEDDPDAVTKALR